MANNQKECIFLLIKKLQTETQKFKNVEHTGWSGTYSILISLK